MNWLSLRTAAVGQRPYKLWALVTGAASLIMATVASADDAGRLAEFKFPRGCHGLTFSGDGKLLAATTNGPTTTAADGAVQFFDVVALKKTNSLRANFSAGIVLSTDGRTLARLSLQAAFGLGPSNYSEVELWDVKSG